MYRGLRLGRIGDIEIVADWSLLIVFFLITFSLAVGMFPAWHPDWTPRVSWLTALAAAVLFFMSITAHELSHAFVGRRGGVRIRRITLFAFGGIAHMENEPPSWKVELRMAVVGPVTSLLLGVTFLGMAAAMIGDIAIDESQANAFLARLTPAESVLLWLGWINVGLAMFNLVPGFPLDGGRVLRSIAWGATGSIQRATRLASLAGQAFAWLLMTTGFAMALGLRVPVFGTGFAGGLWLLLIGWFLNNAAIASYRQVLINEALENVPVADLMQTHIVRVAPAMTVRELVDRCVMASGQRAFPVENASGDFLGLVALRDVGKLNLKRWESATLGEIMAPAANLTKLSSQQTIGEVIDQLVRPDVEQLPVLDGRRLIGLLGREELAKWLSLRMPRRSESSRGGDALDLRV